MTLLALLLAAGPVVLINETIEIPRAEWRYVDVFVKDDAATVNCEFQVVSGNPKVRLLWLARKDLQEFRRGSLDQVIAETGFENGGKLRRRAHPAGDYALVLENEKSGHGAAKVRVKLWLDSAPTPRYLSPARRWAVIAISLALFGAVVAYVARKLPMAAMTASCCHRDNSG